MDLGDHTSNPGYTKIYRVDWQDKTPFGEIKDFIDMLVSFQKSLAKTLPSDLLLALPSSGEITKVFTRTFVEARAEEMVLLTGVPKEILSGLQDSPRLQALGKALVEIARAGNTETVYMDHAGWENKGTYDVGVILSRLAANPRAALSAEDSTLGELMSNNVTLRSKFLKAYAAFMKEVHGQARQMGVTDHALETFMSEAVKIRNASRPELVRGDRRWHELWDTTNKAIDEKNPSIAYKYIEDQSARAIFNFKDAAPFQLVLKEEKDSLRGVSKRRVYDALRDQSSTVVRVEVAGGMVNFGGREAPFKKTDSLALDLRAHPNVSGSSVVVAAGRESGDWVEFTFDGFKDVNLADVHVVSRSTLRRSQTRECKNLF